MEWKPNEEKTQLELISQVSASISAVRGVGRTVWQRAEGLDTWILSGLAGEERRGWSPSGPGHCWGSLWGPSGLGIQVLRRLLQPLPLFPPSPLPCQVTPAAMQPPGVLKAPCPLPACPLWLGRQGGWRCSCWAWQGLGVPCAGADGGPSLRRVATLVPVPLGGEGLWAWEVEGDWDPGRQNLGS